MRVIFGSDAQRSVLQSRLETIAADTVTSFQLPADAQYLRLHPVTNDVRFAIDEDPDDLTAGNWLAGATAFADVDEVRILPDGPNRTVRILAASETVCYIETA